jgi:EmrB/QacA subfamily drug resistance transporter
MAGEQSGYRWIALSNTTLGVFMALLNTSIVLISLPAIFRGIELDPLEPANVGYLLWLIMGYLLMTAILVVGVGRLGDLFGRVRMYNAGFLVFTLASVALALTPGTGGPAALWLVVFRMVQGIGGALLMANTTAILTDAFPPNQRGLALGLNQVAGLSGTFIGLIAGGVLSVWHWRAVFFVSVPVGLFGTAWAWLRLHEIGARSRLRPDWIGNATFAAGLTSLLIGVTYGIQPHGRHSMGWTSPLVLGTLAAGAVLLACFLLVERRVGNPMLDLRLFRIRAFAAGNFANLLASIGRGGLQFMLVLWLQGIWLPRAGYSFESAPLWAGIYMLPQTGGFLAAGPLFGALSDRYGVRRFATAGLLLVAASFLLLMAIPVEFSYLPFALILVCNGVGMGMFWSPNTASIMSSVPADQRGAASGVWATLLNSGMVLSIGLFFSILVAGLAKGLPPQLEGALAAHGVPAADAARIAGLSPVGSLFAALLGFNPMRELLRPIAGQLSPPDVAALTSSTFFPKLISEPFRHGLAWAFGVSVVLSLLGAAAASICCSKSARRADVP